MKTLVIYYTLTGKSDSIAKEIAQKENARLLELKEKKKSSMLKAFIFGAYKAMKQKKADLQDFDINLKEFEKIIFVMPVWASMPAPAYNNIMEIMPSGKQIEIYLSSASGDSREAKNKLSQQIIAMGCTFVGLTDVKTGK